MKTRPVLVVFLLLVMFFCDSVLLYAQGMSPIQLLPPKTEGGKPLMEALKQRRSLRNFSPKELPLQVLSDLLWAAAGINRPDTGGRTAPTAMDMQEIDIYVAKSDGLYLYDPGANALIPVLAKDVRSFTGEQSFVKEAPINLIYVADHRKMKNLTGEQKNFYAATDTGFISENVYLFCASQGLATVVRGWFNKLSLTKALKLRPSQSIILAQTVGYPKD